MLKKFRAVLVSAVFAFGAFAGSFSAAEAANGPAGGKFNPGAYYATEMGASGPTTVKVTVTEDEITGIFITESRDHLHRKTVVEELLIPEIIDKQSLSVDAISAATLTSGTVIRAAQAALEQAGASREDLFAEYEEDPAPVREDGEEFDVIIVGAGIAGMFTSMSLERRNPGLNVLVLEKSDFIGGSMTVSGANMMALDNEMLRRQGRDITPEELVEGFDAFNKGYDPEYEMNKGLLLNMGYANADLWGVLNEKEAPYDQGRPKDGASGATYYTADSYANETILTLNSGNDLTRYLEPLFYPSCELRLQSEVTNLVVEDGAVTGVEVTEGGQVYNVYSGNVVLATGGIGPNAELMEEFNKDFAGNVYLGHVDSDGAGIELTRELGTSVVGFGVCGSMGVDMMPFSFHYPYGGLGSRAVGGMVTLNGENVTTREELFAAPEQIGFSIWNADSPYYSILEDVEARGIGHKADTIEGLADEIAVRFKDIDKEAFIAAATEIAEANELTAPFYAVRNAYTFYSTTVGLKVNEFCQPLNAEGEVIPGLYAIGELILGNYNIGAYANVGSALALSASGGIVTAKHINGEFEE